MEQYYAKALVAAAEATASALEEIRDRLDELTIPLTAIVNALEVKDTDGKGLADSVDEIRAHLEDATAMRDHSPSVMDFTPRIDMSDVDE